MEHIRIITPHVAPVPRKLEEIADIAESSQVMFSQVNIAGGPISIESAFDEMLCAPGVVGRALEAQAEGVSAIIIDCFADPALRAAREAVSIPVIGPGTASLHLAAQFAHRIGVVTIMESVRALIEDQVRLAGLSDRLACVRVVDMPVREIEGDGETLLSRLIEASELAVLRDRADQIVLGCTGFLGVDTAVTEALHARGLEVSVINPLRAAALAAIAALRLGIAHSPRTYLPLRPKPVRQIDLPTFP
ncbi:MAG: aspartate/glutamate racemase family protein [Nocardioides sp.]